MAAEFEEAQQYNADRAQSKVKREEVKKGIKAYYLEKTPDPVKQDALKGFLAVASYKGVIANGRDVENYEIELKALEKSIDQRKQIDTRYREECDQIQTFVTDIADTNPARKNSFFTDYIDNVYAPNQMYVIVADILQDLSQRG